MQSPALSLVSLEAVLERVTYVNEETGYTIARVAIAKSTDLLTVIGLLLGAQPGRASAFKAAGQAIRSMAASSRCRASRRYFLPRSRASAGILGLG